MAGVRLEGKAGKVGLWVLAFVLMAGAAVYQRMTGPTHPMRGTFTLQGETYTYRLTRSGSTPVEAEVRVPGPDEVSEATLHFTRFKTSEPYTAQPMARHDREFVGKLPRQPAAGKLEYYVTLKTPEGTLRLPEAPEDNPVLRYKDPVPTGVLVPHIVLMFLAMLVGIRAGLSALVGHSDMRTLSWISLAGMTLGGLVLGPIVQKYAFGAYWTGFPFGYDLTDNKVLILWLCWVFACGWQLVPAARQGWTPRAAVGLATLVMLVVYLIPHSLRGSELDYARLEQGVPPHEAIRTGK